MYRLFQAESLWFGLQTWRPWQLRTACFQISQGRSWWKIKPRAVWKETIGCQHLDVKQKSGVFFDASCFSSPRGIGNERTWHFWKLWGRCNEEHQMPDFPEVGSRAFSSMISRLFLSSEVTKSAEVCQRCCDFFFVFPKKDVHSQG